MKVSDKLFQLIGSLTKAEKRYFKLFASIYGGRKNYLRLFDAIDAQQAYDEEELRGLFSSERSLQIAKAYLYDQILRSLRVFHSGASIRSQIRELVQNIEILYEKGLYEQAFKMYETALALAEEHEEFSSVIQILGWGTKLRSEPFTTAEEADLRYDPIYTALDRFRNYLDHLRATVKIGAPTTCDTPRTPGEFDAVDRMMALLPDADEALSVKARVLYLWSYSTYHHLRGEPEESLRYTEQQIALLEEHPAMIAITPHQYLQARTNQISFLKRLGRIDEFHAALEVARSKGEALLAANRIWSPRVRAQLFRTIYLNQLAAHIEMGECRRHPGLAAVVEEGLREHEPYLRPADTIWFKHRLTHFYFELGDLPKALEWNNSIIQDDLPGIHRRIYHHARLLKLLIHYEMGHAELLDYLVVSTYRYFRSRNIIHGFEDAVLDFFRRLLRLKAGEGPLLELFESLRARLADLRRDPVEAEAFDNFDYIGWLDGRIALMRGRSRSDRAASRIAA